MTARITTPSRALSAAVIVLGLVVSMLALSRPAIAACVEAGETAHHNRGDKAPPRFATLAGFRSSSEPAPDANWPVVSKSATTVVDNEGRANPVTTVVRMAPGSVASPSTDATSRSSGGSSETRLASAVAGITCTPNTGATATTSVGIGGGVFTQHFKVYWNRWKVEGTDIGTAYLWGYVNYQTDVWWTRTSTVYNLSDNQTTWMMQAQTCPDGVFDPRGPLSSARPWTPLWETINQTYTYFYNSPMNTWPVEWADVFQPYQSRTSMWTDVTEAGNFFGRINAAYDYPKT